MSRPRFPYPSDDPVFRKFWKSYLPSITNRANFQNFHLLQLEVLCRAHVEEVRLASIIDIQGHTFRTGEDNRNGDQVRPRPEAAQLSTCRAQILQYVKMLGLMPSKPKGNEGGVANEWSSEGTDDSE